jgi:HEAT repeat protein
VLADLLFDRDRDLRLAAATAFVQLRDKSAQPVLSAALRDADIAVREAAQAALAALN